MYKKYTVGQYSNFYTSDAGFAVYPDNYNPVTTKVIIGCHGHGGNALQYGYAPLKKHTEALVRAGYVVVGIDHARVNAWGDAGAVSAIGDAYITYGLTPGGLTSGKVGLMGWSMGGLTAINAARSLGPSVVGALLAFTPATDIRYFRQNSTLYTPSYPLAPATNQGNATYSAELGVTFANSNTTAYNEVTIPAAGSPGVDLTFLTGGVREFADPVMAGTPVTATVNGQTFTYSGKASNNRLTGCVSTGPAVVVGVGATVSSTYDQQVVGYNPWIAAASYGAMNIPTLIVQPTDDDTVPPGMNLDPTNGFVARANSPFVTAYGTLTGGHVTGVSNMPSQAVVDFYKANL